MKGSPRKASADAGKSEPSPAPDQRGGGATVFKALLLALLLVSFLAVLRFSPLAETFETGNLERLRQWLDAYREWAPLAFSLGGAALIGMGAPRSLISVLGGAVFGLWWGLILSLTAAMIGSGVMFWLTRLLGRPLLEKKAGLYLDHIEHYTHHHGFLLVVLLRQLPLTCLFVNVLIGLTAISTKAFLLGSIVGLLPEALIFALFGSSLQDSFLWRVSLAASLLVLLALGLRVYFQRSPLAQGLARHMEPSRHESRADLKG
jgi:uncharacterized membrane protein YdjX (TVP38/TMEM64 family)